MISQQVKDKLLTTLTPLKPKRIGIFGSYARGENQEDSDLDILISFSQRISLLKFVQIQQELSKELGISVDLVSENGIRNQRLKEYIFQDLISIYDEKE